MNNAGTNLTNWRDAVELNKVTLEGFENEPTPYYYEVFRKRDDALLAQLDLHRDGYWVAEMEASGMLLVDMLTADDVLAVAQAMDYLNRLLALDELTHVSQDMGLYEAM